MIAAHQSHTLPSIKRLLSNQSKCRITQTKRSKDSQQLSHNSCKTATIDSNGIASTVLQSSSGVRTATQSPQSTQLFDVRNMVDMDHQQVKCQSSSLSSRFPYYLMSINAYNCILSSPVCYLRRLIERYRRKWIKSAKVTFGEFNLLYIT